TVVREIAEKVGLNIKRFDESLKDPQIRGMINRDLSDGAALQVRGTPSVFINGKVLRNRSMEGFQELIERELKKPARP
ncbi:MAG: DsbA family protein, partial [Proteobacteria bacterium]|nr:DsbA family protein [Pseudomonadota bacterium]